MNETFILGNLETLYERLTISLLSWLFTMSWKLLLEEETI